MYEDSDLFKKAYKYALKYYNYVAILSAKYGLLLPDEEIDPYDFSLDEINVNERKQWAEKTYLQFKKKLPINEISIVFFHTGINYRKDLIALLEKNGMQCLVPLKGLGIGQQKSWYTKK